MMPSYSTLLEHSMQWADKVLRSSLVVGSTTLCAIQPTYMLSVAYHVSRVLFHSI